MRRRWSFSTISAYFSGELKPFRQSRKVSGITDSKPINNPRHPLRAAKSSNSSSSAMSTVDSPCQWTFNGISAANKRRA